MGAGLELPPGFRFHPTDEELVMHYLVPRCASQSVAAPIIAEVDLYKYDPWDLPGKALCGEKEWYFFTPRDRKYPNGSRPNRAAGSGYWKATGADKPIGQPKTLGIKKALVFYAGKAPKGDKTNWIMHEYRLADVDRSARRKNSLRLDDWVLCRIYNKKGKIERRQRPPQQEDRNQTTSFEDYPEDRKPKIPMPRASGIVPPAPPAVATSSYDHVHFDTSDSVPRLHTESSCSEHVVSPEFACEVQSSDASRWPVSGSDLGLDMETPLDFSSEYVGATWGDFGGGPSGSCGSQQLQGANQMSPLQDIFMYLQKPF